MWGLYSRVVLDFARRVDPRIRGEYSRLDHATAVAVRALIDEVWTAAGR